MTTTGSFKLKGIDDYLEAIAKAGNDVDASADKAITAAAEIVQDEMVVLVPKDTENLENHIRIQGPTVDGNLHSIEVGIIHDASFTDADTARYGNAQEYGYDRGGKHFAPESYIRAGTDNKRTAALQAEKKSLQEDGLM